MKITTHRGLDPSISGFPTESSREAFLAQLDRGFGLEFDIRLSSDGVMIAVHDANLKRISKGKDERLIAEVTAEELTAMSFDGAHLMTIPELLNEIEARTSGTISAIHLKKAFQTKACLDKLLEVLALHDPKRYILFDATIETARYIKKTNPALSIAASISHPYDIHRYNSVVGGTLYSMEELIANNDLFDWAWLDEWDLADVNGGGKKLLTRETFAILREHDIKIALVTPELHGTSPGLLGGEAHPDATPHETRWKDRMREILKLNPDIVCTDYPDEVLKMVT